MSDPSVRAYAGAVADSLLAAGAKQATKYVASDLVIKATVIGDKPRKRDRQIHLRVTIGKPNYRERAFIRRCERDGVALVTQQVKVRPFPSPKRRKR